MEFSSETFFTKEEQCAGLCGTGRQLCLARRISAGARQGSLPQGPRSGRPSLALNDTLAEAHTSLADIKVDYDWDWPGAEQEFRRAIELNPDPTTHQWYAEFLSEMGRHREALVESALAQKLDPNSPIINAGVGKILFESGQNDAALGPLKKTTDLAPNFAHAHSYLGKFCLRKKVSGSGARIREGRWLVGEDCRLSRRPRACLCAGWQNRRCGQSSR